MGITMAMGWNPCLTAVLENYWKQYVFFGKIAFIKKSKQTSSVSIFNW